MWLSALKRLLTVKAVGYLYQTAILPLIFQYKKHLGSNENMMGDENLIIKDCIDI